MTQTEPNAKKYPIITDTEFLSQVSRDITKDELRDMKLHDTLKEAAAGAWVTATGLSAIQIGIPLRFAWYQLIDPKTAMKSKPVILVNPEIIKAEQLVPFKNEGCLSIPHYWFNTWRFNRITYLSGLDSGRKPFDAVGFEAFVIQHEIDHMNGILCTSRTRKPESAGRNEPCPCGSGKKFKKCCQETATVQTEAK